MTQPDRYFLHAFVGIDGSVQHYDGIGWMTVGQVTMQRRWDDQYAVVHDHKHSVQVWDMLDTEWTARMYMGPPRIVGWYEQVDQAIMATALVVGGDDADLS